MLIGGLLVTRIEPSGDPVDQRVGQAVQEGVTDVVRRVVPRMAAFGEHQTETRQEQRQGRSGGVAEVVGDLGVGGEDPA